MSHFAKVENGVVTKVIVAEKEFFDTYVDDTPGQWIQTSYNTRAGVHYGSDGNPDGGIALRGNYAGIGYIYDEKLDLFITKQPYPSWTLNITTAQWESPIPLPMDGKMYSWDEATASWIEVTE